MQPIHVPYDAAEIADWAGTFAQKAMGYGLISGVGKPAPQFAGKRNVTRGEFVALLLRAMGRSAESEEGAVKNAYKDVPSTAWYAGYVTRAKQVGLVDGTAARFYPDRPVTREEAAIMLVRAAGLKAAESSASGLMDAEQVSERALPYVNAVIDAEYMKTSGGKFSPKTAITREMAAVIAVKLWELSVGRKL